MQSNTLKWICGFKNTLVESGDIDLLALQTTISSLPKAIPKCNKKIILIQQFFIHNDKRRHQETLETLAMNAHNNSIDEIHLINERIYTSEEMGTSNKKIRQFVDGGKRLTYKQAMKYAMDNLHDSIVILANSDIFFDKTISSCRLIDLTESMICLSRYKLNGKNLEIASPETFSGLSQDTWIWDSETSFSERELNACNFQLGKPGCDNRIMLLASDMGLKVYNIPNVIKGYHHHSSNIRNYSRADTILPQRYLAMLPPVSNMPTLTSFLPANDMQVICNFYDNTGIPSIVNASQEDMVLLRKGVLSLNDPDLSLTIDDVKRFVKQSNFVLIDIPFYLKYHQQDNMRVESALNTQWLNMKNKYLDARCFDLCVSKRHNFLQYTNKSIIIVTSRKALLKKRIDNDNCRFTKNIKLIDANISSISDTLKNIETIYDVNKIIILDTGYDLIFGALLSRYNIPSIAIGSSLNSYFKILNKKQAVKLVDSYELEADNTWMIV